MEVGPGPGQETVILLETLNRAESYFPYKLPFHDLRECVSGMASFHVRDLANVPIPLERQKEVRSGEMQMG